MEILRAKLPIVHQLGMKRKGANKVKQLRFFRTSTSEISGEGEGEHSQADLDFQILDAILSDCEKTEEAIMHAGNTMPPPNTMQAIMHAGARHAPPKHHAGHHACG